MKILFMSGFLFNIYGWDGSKISARVMVFCVLKFDITLLVAQFVILRSDNAGIDRYLFQ